MRRSSKLIRAAIAALALSLFASSAQAWDIESMNKTINSTNFVLDNQCSATLISIPKKLVLTNYHCVDAKITTVEKEIVGPDGSPKKVKVFKYETVSLVQKSYSGFEQVGASEYLAEIVAHNKGKDLALVQIKADSIPHTIASQVMPEGKTLVRGEKVYLVGNPLLLDATVSDGIISSLNRTFDFEWLDGEKLPFIQVTAPMTGGNSGGSLYNNDGLLIGVPAAGTRGAGAIGLAVPVHIVRDLLKRACFETVYGGAAEEETKCLALKEAAKKRAEAGPKMEEGK